MAIFTLLFTAFLPKVGLQFPWVTYHWIAGTVLTISIIFHVIHASFWLDFLSICPDRIDMIQFLPVSAGAQLIRSSFVLPPLKAGWLKGTSTN
jgi:hypothetical protein